MSTTATAPTEVSRPRLRWSVDPMGLDWPLLGITLVLAAFGLVMILSASWDVAERLVSMPLHFVVRQAAGLGVGAVAALVLVGLPYRTVRNLTWPLYLAAVLLLVAVWSPLGHTVNGATRWLWFGFVNLQPSEIAKLALVGVLADYLANNRGRLRDVVGVGLPGLGILLPLLVLVIFQRDFGTTVILLALAATLFLIAGLQWSTLGAGIAAGVGVLGLLVAAEPYRMERVTSFLNPYLNRDDGGYQVVQGWIALATGGWTGSGVAVGVAQRGFVPEAHTDMIMTVVGEELGAIGFLGVVALLMVLVWRCFHVAVRAPDLFGMLVAGGVGTMFASQAIINIGVVGGLLPTKGLVLPFLSYGPSAALVNAIGCGLVLKVALQTHLVHHHATGEPGSSAITEGEGS